MAVRRKCAVSDCDAASKSLGWCAKHYGRWKRNGDPEALSTRADDWRRKRPVGAVCVTAGCSQVLNGRGEGRGMCSKHYQRWRLHGDVSRGRKVGRGTCSIENCTLPVAGRGWCSGHWSNWRRHGAPEVELGCVVCATPFLRSTQYRLYCSAPCADLATRIHGRAHSSNRRAAKRASKVVPVRPIDIFVRDQWTCQLCDEAIDGRLAWPEPMSPSLDHKVPLSRGGAHVPANLQASHLRCNLRKGAAVLEGVA